MKNTEDLELENLQEELETYNKETEAFLSFVKFQSYVESVKNKRMLDCIFGSQLFLDFLHDFARVTISYKNFNIEDRYKKNQDNRKRILKKLQIIPTKKMRLSKETTQLIKQSAENEKKIFSIFSNLNQKDTLKTTPNLFIDAISNCSYCLMTFQESFGEEKTEIPLQIEFLKDIIMYFEEREKQNDLYAIIQAIFSYDRRIPDNIWEKRQAIQITFRETEKEFQQLLMYAKNNYSLLEILLRFHLIDSKNLILESEKGKHSILSLELEENFSIDSHNEFLSSYYLLYENLELPKEIRDNDDIEILCKINIEDLSFLLYSKKFIMTESKLEEIIKRIRIYTLSKNFQIQVIEDIWKSLSLKTSHDNQAYLEKLENETDRNKIAERRRLIAKFQSILIYFKENIDQQNAIKILKRKNRK